MEKKVIQKNLIRDCLPTVFSLMLSGLYSVMDGLFVGRQREIPGLQQLILHGTCCSDHCNRDRDWKWRQCFVFEFGWER